MLHGEGFFSVVKLIVACSEIVSELPFWSEPLPEPL